MFEREVRVPPNSDLSGAELLIERLCAVEGLEANRKMTMVQPGSVHWHFKRGSERGTLEVTLWQNQKRILLSVHDNRQGPWVARSIARLKTAVERELRLRDKIR